MVSRYVYLPMSNPFKYVEKKKSPEAKQYETMYIMKISIVVRKKKIEKYNNLTSPSKWV